MPPLFSRIEPLEIRIALATFVWDGSRSSDWLDPLNWTPDGVPGAADTATLDIASTVNLSSAVSVGIFRQSAGVLTSVPGVALTVLQSLDWSGGTMSGAGATVLPAGSVSIFAGAAIKQSIDRAIDIAGVVTWSGNGALALDEATLTIQAGGLLDIQTDAAIGDSNGTGSTGRPPGTLIIGGTLRKSASSGTTDIGGTLAPSGDGRVNTTLNAGGKIEVQSGMLHFIGGSVTMSGSFDVSPTATVEVDVTATVSDGAAFLGSGTVRLRNGANFSGGTVTSTSLELAGGTFAGGAIISGDWLWSSGRTTGNFTHAAGGMLSLSGSAQRAIETGTFRLAGSAIWSGTGTLAIDDGTLAIPSGGLLDIQNDSTIGDSNGTASTGRPAGTLIIDGVLRKSAGSGTTTIGGTLPPSGDGRVNTIVGAGGSIEVQSGTLNFLGGTLTTSGSIKVAAGATLLIDVPPELGNATDFTGPGATHLRAGANLTGGMVKVLNLDLAGGNLSGSGIILGDWSWSGGTSTANITHAAGGVLTLSGANRKTINIGAFNIAGSAIWSGSGELAIDDATVTIESGGLFDIQTDAVLGDSNGTASTGRPPGTLVVDGTLRKSASAGTTTIGGTLAPSGDGRVNTRVGSIGMVEVQSGTLSFVTGAFDNSGVVDAVANNLLIGGGGVSSGTFIVSSGGNIRFTGGRQSLTNGSSLSGGGQHEIAGGQLDADAAVSATNLAFSSGFLGGSGELTIMQNFAWSGGTMVGAGTTTLAAGSISVFSGAALKRSLDRAIQLAGTATWTGSGDLALDDSTFTIEANGLLDIQTDATIGDSNGTGSTGRPAGTLIVDGTLRKSASSGTTTIGGTLAPSGDGLVDTTVRAGGRIEVQTGSLTFIGRALATSGAFDVAANSTLSVNVSASVGDGAIFSGNGAVRMLSGANFTNANITSTSLELAGGNFTGAAIISGDWSWTAGRSSGSFTHAAGGVLALSGNGSRAMNTGTFNIAGIARWSGSGVLALDDATLTIESSGLLDIQNDSIIGDSNGTGSTGRPAGTLIIDGILRKSAGQGTTTIGGTLPPSGDGRVNTVLNGSGRIEVQTGSVNFVGGSLSIGAPISVASGASVDIDVAPALGEGADFTGPGATHLRAGANLTGGMVKVLNLDLAGGNLSGSGIILGDWSWSGGTSTANITHAAGGVLTLSGANRKTINIGAFNIAGSAIWSGSGELAIDDATVTIESGGLFDIQTDAVLGDSNGTASTGRPPGTLIVDGTLRKSASAGTTTIGGTLAPSGDGRVDIAVHPGGSIEAESGVLRFLAGTFVNAGSVNAKAGGLEFANFTQTAGVTNLVQSNIGGGVIFRFEGGELRGNGTITGDVVNVGATVQPGGSKGAGTLMVAGNYEQQSSGKLAIDLGGSNAGIDSDQLLITDVATLDGILKVNSIGGFIIPDGGTFTVMSYASSNGSFASLDAPAGLTVDQRATELFLSANAPPAGPRSVTLTDIDGDVVTVKVNKGSLPANAIQLGLNGELQRIDLRTIGSTLAGAKLIIEAQQAGGGDGAVNVGAIDATGMDFAKVSVDGDLGQIDIGTGDARKPALKSLAVGSLGAMGASTQASGTDDPLLSEIVGSLGKLSVARDVKNAVVTVAGKLGKISIGGNLIDSAAVTGLVSGPTIGVFLNGGIPPTNASHAGAIFAPDIGSVTVMGDIDGGEIGADNQIKKVKVVGKLMSDDPLDPAILRVGANIEKTIINGDVQNALILAGYNRDLEPRNPDATIGNITVKGNWNASSLVAGVADPGDNGFGFNDTIISGDDTPGVFSRIAKVIIKGSASGSATLSDRSAITAQELGALQVGGLKIPLTRDRDDIALDPGRANFRAVEI